ncbi:redox-regulated ATPase YchF, partial [Candidatus Peregrinibacteria bacterium]|nr:redox-regulated ATPase YchF [Candidatus Peregrinibacteria bacterium]
MALKIGIVGLPNVGKSTLFNALTRNKTAEAANYPFCTIDPNVGIVEVPDQRMTKLIEISKSEKAIPTAIEFVDIAGLVKGASQGEGLGNKFLSHIRECNAIGHVIRIFDDPNITHVHGTINPKEDREVIESELLLADLQTLEKRLDKAKSDAKSGDKEKKAYADLVQMVNDELNAGKLASNLDLSQEEKLQLRDLHLLTMKPNLYIINVPESEVSDIDRQKYASALGVYDPGKVIPICAKLEEELSDLSFEESSEYLQSLNVKDTGLNALIRSAYDTLGLITYFTSGPKETRAWTIQKGTLAPQAAGTIHTDFEKGFIKAEVVHADHFI